MDLFSLIVISTFILQIYFIYEIGQGRIHYVLMMAIHSLFGLSEAWIAIVDEGRFTYWLYVALSVFAVSQAVVGYVRTKKV